MQKTQFEIIVQSLAIIRTQVNIDPVYFTFSPENYDIFAPWFHCAIYFGAICHRYQR